MVHVNPGFAFVCFLRKTWPCFRVLLEIYLFFFGVILEQLLVTMGTSGWYFTF